MKYILEDRRLEAHEALDCTAGCREYDIPAVTEDGAENATDIPYGPERAIVGV